jgi:hypothetical protein
MPLKIQRIADHEVIEVLMPQPHQPYDHVTIRDPTTGRMTWTVLDCEQQDEA